MIARATLETRTIDCADCDATGRLGDGSRCRLCDGTAELQLTLATDATEEDEWDATWALRTQRMPELFPVLTDADRIERNVVAADEQSKLNRKEQTMEATKIRPEVLADLDEYLTKGIEPYPYLLAILKNDLRGAFAHCDREFYDEIAALVRHCHWEIPSVAWGSPLMVKNWVAEREAENVARCALCKELPATRGKHCRMCADEIRQCHAEDAADGRRDDELCEREESL